MSLSRQQTVRAYEDGGEGLFWASIAEAGLSPAEQRVIESAIGKEGGRVLSIGCGAGRESLALARAGFTTMGIDLSRALLRKATAHGGGLPHLAYASANAVALPFRDKSFDHVLMLSPMLGHIPGANMRRWALTEAARVLRPDGTILVSLYMRSLKDYPLSYLVWLTVARKWRGRLASEGTQPMLPSTSETPESLRIERLAEVVATMLRARILQLRMAARVLRKRIGGMGNTSLEGRDIYVHPRLYRVSLTPRPGLAYFHLYARREWLADVREAGLVVENLHSIRELTTGRRLPPLLRDLDHLHFYALRRA